MLDTKYESFLAVAAERSFTKAAAQLNLTQPAVSQQIRQLESQLGVTLFDRKPGGLKLTPEGEIVLKYANRMNNVTRNMHKALKNYRLHRHSLTVGISHSSESNIIPEALALYSARHDNLSITLISDSIKNLYDKLKNFEIDLGIAEGRVTDPSLNSVVLDTDYLAVIVSPDHPLAEKNAVTLRELQDEKLILRLPSSTTRKLFVSQLESRRLSLNDFNVIIELDNIAMIKDLIRRDIGISILMRSTCQDELGKGKLVALPIENLSLGLEVNFIYRKNFSDHKLIDEIMEIYRGLAAENGR